MGKYDKHMIDVSSSMDETHKDLVNAILRVANELAEANRLTRMRNISLELCEDEA